MYLVDYMERKESENFLSKGVTTQKIKWKVITTSVFWCKEQDIEEKFQLVDFTGSL